MFPISDSIKSRIFPVLTLLIILINVYVFIRELSSPNIDNFIFNYALIPQNINFMDITTLTPFITSMFLHGGFLHIISNMWFLWIFGDDIEAYFGKIWFLLIYIAAGLAGNFLQFAFNPSSAIPMLGASGAVSGVLGAYYVLFPKSKIKTVLLIFFFITIVEIPAVIYLFYWFFLQIFSGLISLNFASQTGGGVAFWAHVGGFIVGVLSAMVMKREKDKNYIEGEIVT